MENVAHDQSKRYNASEPHHRSGEDEGDLMECHVRRYGDDRYGRSFYQWGVFLVGLMLCLPGPSSSGIGQVRLI